MRHGEAKRLGGLEIDRKLELGRLLDRHVCRFSAPKNATDVVTGLAKHAGKAGPITDEATGRDILARIIDRGNRMARCQSGDRSRRLWKDESGITNKASIFNSTNLAKAASMS